MATRRHEPVADRQKVYVGVKLYRTDFIDILDVFENSIMEVSFEDRDHEYDEVVDLERDTGPVINRLVILARSRYEQNKAVVEFPKHCAYRILIERNYVWTSFDGDLVKCNEVDRRIHAILSSASNEHAEIFSSTWYVILVWLLSTIPLVVLLAIFFPGVPSKKAVGFALFSMPAIMIILIVMRQNYISCKLFIRVNRGDDSFWQKMKHQTALAILQAVLALIGGIVVGYIVGKGGGK